MNRLRNIVGLIAVCATVAFFTGCGDDHETTSGSASNAPDGLNGQTYQLTDSGTGGTIAFDAAANNYNLNQGGTTETGTFTANRSGDVWNVTTVDSTGTTTSQLTLTFTSSGVGTYTFQRPGQALAQGSFALSSSGSTTSTGTSTSTGTTTNTGTTTSTGTTTDTGTSTSTGTTTDTGTSTSTGTTTDTGTSTSTGTTTNTGTTTSTGTTTGTTTGPGTVPAPTTLSSINVITGAGSGVGEGASYTVVLSGGASGTFQITNSGSQGNGNYTYTPNGTQAHLRLDYTGGLQGDFDDMTLIFTTQPGGAVNNYTGTQRVGGNDYPFTGTFTY